MVEGFIKRYDHLPITELWLVDVPAGQEKLDIVGNLAKRMVEKAGLPIEVHLTLDRRAALKDADFVTTQLRVGLLDARVKDETIPAKYGILGQETNGPGGLFKGFRTIPVILDIKKITNSYPKASVAVRNFPLSAQELRERLKIEEGDEFFLFGTHLPNNQRKIIICKKSPTLGVNI